ncbi:cyclic-phosphate processing receiver domain-containing protein [Paraburkholderia sp. IW21]|uniref:cyclic-phosphate processing receiver domain-containing protein n=1 Tax=Paraburkholderia sp. IW21 TaxID=3242488 RepID=UPI003521ECDB
METRYRLFIDDIRDPVASDWVIARTSLEATTILEARGCPFEISFDHDLGGEDTAMVVVRKLVAMDLDAGGGFIPAGFVYSVHSANPVGKRNIEGLLDAYLRQREISGNRPAAC